MQMIDTFLKPMHPEGWKFVPVFAAVTLVLFLIWDPLGWIGVGLTIWCYYFFRDPKRSVPQNAGLAGQPGGWGGQPDRARGAARPSWALAPRRWSGFRSSCRSSTAT